MLGGWIVKVRTSLFWPRGYFFILPSVESEIAFFVLSKPVRVFESGSCPNSLNNQLLTHKHLLNLAGFYTQRISGYGVTIE